MSRLFPILTLLSALGFLGCAHTSISDRPPAPAPWPHEISDLKPDPAVRWGRLDNGLRYAILPHPTPRQRASVSLLVQVGSYHERNSERGFAHFVEHMAFRDLRDFPGQSAISLLQKIGAGPHVNADTGMFETKYYFHNLPADDPEALPLGLKLIRSFADGVVFAPESIERERGVIFGEMRSRDAMLATQARPDELEFIAPREAPPRWPELSVLFEKTQIAKRHPIGEPETLRAANAEKLRMFYDRWYRPERMILVVVGDVDAVAVDQRIRETFSPLVARGRTPAEPKLPLPKNPGRLHISDDANEPAILVSLGVARMHRTVDDTSTRARSLAGRVALAMLARRLSRAEEAADAPFFSSDLLASHYVPARELVLLRAATRPESWLKTISAFDFEVRRINELGFSAAEFELAAKRETFKTAAAARQAAQRSSAELATALAVSAARGVVFTSADNDHELTTSQLASLDAQQCHATFRDLLHSGEWSMAVIGPLGGRPPSSFTLNFKESRTAPLTPYEAPAPPGPFPFTDFGPPGVIVKNEYVPAIDTQLVQFANGVRLNLKNNRFEPGQVHVRIQLTGGRMACPSDKPGLDFRTFAWIFGGLRGLSLEELNHLFTGRITSVSYDVSPTVFKFAASAESEHVPFVFQAGAAFFVRPAFSANAGARALEIARQITAPHTSTANGVAHLAMWQRITGGHAGFRFASMEETSQRTLDELKAWFEPQLATAPLEIGVIGDFDPAVVIDACARTFGALPPRATDDPLAGKRNAVFPPAPFSETMTFNGTQGVAVVTLAWPTPSAAAFPVQFHAHILAKILENRLVQKLRVEMGETYSAGAGLAVEHGFEPAVAFLRCTVEAAPERVEQVAAAAREVVATLVREGVTPDEFERARQPLVRGTESELHSNTWWSDIVAVAQSNPAYAEGWARALQVYESAALDDINALARNVLSTERLCELVVVPK